MAKPEIRLKGFEGEWVKTSFKELAQLRRGLTYSPSNIRSQGVRVLRSSNIDEDNFSISDDDVFVTKECVNIPLANDGDILITAANGSPRLVGKHCIITNTTKSPMVHGGFMLLASSKESDFVNASMGSSWFRDFQRIGIAGGNGAIGNLNKNELELFEFLIPKEKLERDAIAEYFNSLDSMIQATTKKIASLKQMKSASLISMFPQAGETTPRVRFKGFEGDWRKVKLEDCLEVCKDRNTDEKYNRCDVLSVSDDYGVVNQIKLLGRSYAGKSVANYRLLKTGDVVYTKSPLKIKPFGIIKVNEGPTGIVSTLYAVYSPKEGVSSQYINYYFEPSYRMNKYIHPLVNKGAKNDMKVSDENVLKGYITIPKDIKEQQRIASYFRSLDKQISLQEQRLEKLKQIKSACLDKMFV